MRNTLDELERLFQENAVPRDETGQLRVLATLLAEQRPLLLFLAAADGGVKAADDFGSSAELSLARELAGKAAAHDAAEPPVWTTLVAGQPRRAFGLRLEDRPDSALLGGLLADSDDRPALPPATLGALRVAGRLAWWGVQHDETNARLQKRVQHLTAEHETFKTAHTEALVRAIEEHEQRLREEQERLSDGAAVRGHRSRQPGQERVPGQHEPRDPHAADRHPRLHRPAAQRGRTTATSRAPATTWRTIHTQRQAPAGADQRHPRPLQDRGRPDGGRARSAARRTQIVADVVVAACGSAPGEGPAR